MTEKKGGLWGGRFEGGLDPRMEPLNRCLDVDWRLRYHDINGSKAWARALGRAGVLQESEATTLRDGLDAVRVLLEGTSSPAGFADEDIHSLVERLLTEAVGSVGGKLHTGRSRNDQVATDFRLWGMEGVDLVSEAVRSVLEAALETAEGAKDLIMPGYTHLQQAQPVPAAHWLLSRAWPLQRDLERLQDLRKEIGVLPLGSGAIAGCPFPVDREWLADELGFHSVTQNSMDAVSDRDWVAGFLFVGSLIAIHLSQLSEDLVLFSSREFGFLRLGEGFTTGSSLMPQKRNPDVAELIRGKSGRVVGGLVQMLTILKGLPGGYNRDLQEDKAAAFDCLDTLLLVLPAMAGAVESLSFNRQRIESTLDDNLLATDLADFLVRRGVPFRESHHVIGELVRMAEDSRKGLAELTVAEMQSIHGAFDDDVVDVFDWTRSVSSRQSIGGTAPEAVDAQMQALRIRLAQTPPTG